MSDITGDIQRYVNFIERAWNMGYGDRANLISDIASRRLAKKQLRTVQQILTVRLDYGSMLAAMGRL